MKFLVVLIGSILISCSVVYGDPYRPSHGAKPYQPRYGGGSTDVFLRKDLGSPFQTMPKDAVYPQGGKPCKKTSRKCRQPKTVGREHSFRSVER